MLEKTPKAERHWKKAAPIWRRLQDKYGSLCLDCRRKLMEREAKKPRPFQSDLQHTHEWYEFKGLQVSYLESLILEYLYKHLEEDISSKTLADAVYGVQLHDTIHGLCQRIYKIRQRVDLHSIGLKIKSIRQGYRMIHVEH